MPEPIGQLLTYQTVAQDLACGQTTVKLLARKGLLKRVRLVIPGRRRAMARITKASVEKYKADCLAPAPEPVRRRPGFIGMDVFHASHRSNLLRKDPEHYGQFGWTEPATLPYLWPVRT